MTITPLYILSFVTLYLIIDIMNVSDIRIPEAVATLAPFSSEPQSTLYINRYLKNILLV
jgi:hypothetical protein